MKKIIKRELLFDQTEIDYVTRRVSNNTYFSIKKTVEMDIDNENYKVKLHSDNSEGTNFLTLDVEFIPMDTGKGKFNKFGVAEYANYNTYRDCLGVKEIEVKNLKEKRKIKFLLNITLNKNSYKTINEYQKKILESYSLRNLKKN